MHNDIIYTILLLSSQLTTITNIIMLNKSTLTLKDDTNLWSTKLQSQSLPILTQTPNFNYYKSIILYKKQITYILKILTKENNHNDPSQLYVTYNSLNDLSFLPLSSINKLKEDFEPDLIPTFEISLDSITEPIYLSISVVYETEYSLSCYFNHIHISYNTLLKYLITSLYNNNNNFIDADNLPYRLNQLVAFIKDYHVECESDCDLLIKALTRVKYWYNGDL